MGSTEGIGPKRDSLLLLLCVWGDDEEGVAGTERGELAKGFRRGGRCVPRTAPLCCGLAYVSSRSMVGWYWGRFERERGMQSVFGVSEPDCGATHEGTGTLDAVG